ncbi:MliC family protein [Oceanimonas sp. CHS3-5]|uniref:MliC family protein n=1 Tax=Oceanimonas sp. CHS3-5 TaxID=3068186 RepID=UPI00273D1EAF|nr:MliC family protein [Oceanimonas sp. CHS3-5]MDP5290942.1 MliC family protein [Oceanimonas sp. CHS3-5]
MKRGLLLLIFAALPAWAQNVPLCSPEWAQWVEQKVQTGDGRGHGPDTGTDEWKSVVEFRLGIRGDAAVPARETQAWCEHIDALVKQGPSFSCKGVQPGSMEAMICNDAGLAARDRQLAGVYQRALAKAGNEQPPMLRAEQRGWIKGRNDCWKSEDQRACVRLQYELHTAELQARYRLVPARGPFRFACDGNPTNEVVVTFFDTQPSTLNAEYGDSVSLMYIQPSASGSRYEGRNESFWEHQGKATVRWGHDSPEMRCERVK